jgi:hypothetical protein
LPKRRVRLKGSNIYVELRIDGNLVLLAKQLGLEADVVLGDVQNSVLSDSLMVEHAILKCLYQNFFGTL